MLASPARPPAASHVPHGAPQKVRRPVQDARRLLQAIDANGEKAKDARNVLDGHSRRDDAVVALCVRQVLLVLQKPASRRNRIAEAQTDLHAQTEVWATGFAAASRTRQVAGTAKVAAHVIVQRAPTKLKARARPAPEGIAAEARRRARGLHQRNRPRSLVPAIKG